MPYAGLDYLEQPPDEETAAYLGSREHQRVDEAFRQSLAEQIKGMFDPVEALKTSAAMAAGGPALGPLIDRTRQAYRSDNLLPIVSPEAELVRQVVSAPSAEAAQAPLASLAINALQAGIVPAIHAGVRSAIPYRPEMPPPVPDWAVRGPQLSVMPESPYAPVNPDQALAQAIAQAQQTKVQRALAAQQQAQAAPPAPLGPLEGPAPAPWSPLDAAAQQQAIQRQMAVLGQQAALETAVSGRPTPHTARQIEALNQLLQQGLQAAPETRFTIPEPVGVKYASPVSSTGQISKQPVRPSVGQGAPLRPTVAQPPQIQGAGGNVPGPQPITAQLSTQPGQPAVPPTAGPPPPYAPPGTPPLPVESGVRHESLETQFPPGTIQRGAVSQPGDVVAQARANVGKPGHDPYRAVAKVRSGAGISMDELGDIIVEHERLRNIATQLEQRFQANRNPQTLADWNAANQVSQDFAVNVVKPAGTYFGEYGRALQEVSPPNPLTITGAEEIARKRLGQELSPRQKSTIARNTATNQSNVAKANARARKAVAKVGPGTISEAEFTNKMKDIMKKLMPCNP